MAAGAAFPLLFFSPFFMRYPSRYLCQLCRRWRSRATCLLATTTSAAGCSFSVSCRTWMDLRMDLHFIMSLDVWSPDTSHSQSVLLSLSLRVFSTGQSPAYTMVMIRGHTAYGAARAGRHPDPEHIFGSSACVSFALHESGVFFFLATSIYLCRRVWLFIFDETFRDSAIMLIHPPRSRLSASTDGHVSNTKFLPHCGRLAKLAS